MRSRGASEALNRQFASQSDWPQTTIQLYMSASQLSISKYTELTKILTDKKCTFTIHFTIHQDDSDGDSQIFLNLSIQESQEVEGADRLQIKTITP